jgi:hypothetical protein
MPGFYVKDIEKETIITDNKCVIETEGTKKKLRVNRGSSV